MRWTGRSVAIGAAVVAGLGVVFVLLSRCTSDDAAGRPSADKAESAGRVPIESSPAVTPPPSDAPKPIDTAPFDVASEEARTGTRGSEAVLRGRCVDGATLKPLAGCEVALLGRPWGDSRNAAEEALEAGFAWRDPPPDTTGDDGRFEVRFAFRSSLSYSARISAPSRVEMIANGIVLAPGESDCGDIVLTTGVPLRGRLLTADGAPVAAATVRLTSDGSKSRIFAPKTPVEFTTGSDGEFGARHAIVPGFWSISVSAYADVEPSHTRVGVTDRELVLELRVPGEREFPTICGRVVDDRGQGVRNAVVSAVGGPAKAGSSSAVTGAEGFFRIVAPRAVAAGDVTLVATREGHEVGRTAGPVAWGSRGVAIVLIRGIDLTLVVTRADDGRPVLEYGCRVFPASPPEGIARGAQLRLRDSGRHDEGRVVFAALGRGTWCIIVHPTPEAALAPAFVTAEVSEGRPTELHVALEPLVERMLHVRTRDGKPVAGTRFELLGAKSPGMSAPPRPATGTSYRAETLAATGFVSLAAGTTDREGRGLLRGPAAAPLHLLVSGAGHAPLSVSEVVLGEGSGDLEVVVDQGATVIGRLVPREFVAQLLPPELLVGDSWRVISPSIRLRPEPGRGRYATAESGDVFVDEEGRFTVSNLLAGSYAVIAHDLDREGSSRIGGRERRIGTIPELALGEVRSVELDVSRFLRGTVRGTLRVDGVPLQAGMAELLSTDDHVIGSSSRVCAIANGGRFNFSAWGGSHRVRFERRPREPSGLCYGPSIVTVEPGRIHEIDLDFSSSEIAVRLLAPDGRTPVEGVPVRLGLDGTSFGSRLTESDSAGWTRCETVAGLVFRAAVLAKRTTSGSTAAVRIGAPPASEWVDLGTVTTRAPRTEVVLVLPASAGY